MQFLFKKRQAPTAPQHHRMSWEPNNPAGFMQGEQRIEGRLYHIKGWKGWSDGKKVKALRELAVRYGNDPAMRWFVVNTVLRPAGAEPRDWPAQAAAILKFVQERIYYTNEPGEQLQSPWWTLRVATGDCFAEGTKVLRADGALVAIEDVQLGDVIWGRDAWTTVEAWEDKGDLAVTEIDVNGEVVRLTEEHQVYIVGEDPDTEEPTRITVAELEAGMTLLTPRCAPIPGTAGAWAPRKGVDGRLAGIVTEVRREVETVRCYDIQTTDHYVYLPEARVTVSNCDDMAILMGAMAESIRLPWKFALGGADRQGEKLRWVEGDSKGLLARGKWHHIYIMLGWPPFHPNVWRSAEPTMKGVPLGYDVVTQGRPGAARLDMGDVTSLPDVSALPSVTSLPDTSTSLPAETEQFVVRQAGIDQSTEQTQEGPMRRYNYRRPAFGATAPTRAGVAVGSGVAASTSAEEGQQVIADEDDYYMAAWKAGGIRALWKAIPLWGILFAVIQGVAVTLLTTKILEARERRMGRA